MFGAEITMVPVEAVHQTIENKLEQLKKSGKKTLFYSKVVVMEILGQRLTFSVMKK